MNCCTNCFRDSEIKAIIENGHLTGNCDFCGIENVPIYRIGQDLQLSELFDELLDVYTPVASLPAGFPTENTDLIRNLFHTKWNIFNLEPSDISRLIKQVCADRYRNQPELFDAPVGILESNDTQYLESNTVLKKYQWINFVSAIKHENRFHSDFINKSILAIFLHCVRKTYKKGTVFFRARVCPTSRGLQKDEMGAPPKYLATAGRVNSEGVSILYLSTSEETTLYEVRAGISDFVTIGSFKLKEDIEIIDLAMIDKISPFLGITNGYDFTQYAMNLEPLRMISSEISKPLRRQDSILDYIPTQYISDFIRSKGYYGIEFRSTMCTHGENVAIFDSSLFSCTKVKTFNVKSVVYSYADAT